MADPFAQYATTPAQGGDDPFAQYEDKSGSAPASSQPDTWWGGFTQSLLDTAKKTGKGILEGLNPISAIGDTAHAVAHPIDTAKGIASTVAHPVNTIEALSDPETGGKAIGNLLLGEAVPRVVPKVAPYVPAAVSATGRGLEAVGTATKKPLGTLGMTEAFARMDPYGVAAMAAPYAAEYAGKGLQKLGDALDGLKPAPEVDRYAPNVSSTRQVSYAPGAVSDSVRAASSPMVEAHSPNTSGYRPGAEFSSVDDVLPEPTSAMVDRYSPNTGGAGVPKTTPVSDTRLDELTQFFAGKSPAELDNIARDAPYGEGSIMPSGIKPSEYRDFELEGAERAADTGKVYDMRYGGVVPDFTFEAGEADRPGLSLDLGPSHMAPSEPPARPEGAAPQPLEEPPAGAESTKGVPYGPASDRVDLESFFGPGSTSFENPEIQAQATPRKGEPGYAAGHDLSNQLYDPQTPTAHIRELYQRAADAAASDLPEATRAQFREIANFYAKVLDQRNRIALSNVLKGLGRPRAELNTHLPPNVRTLQVKPFVVPR